MKRLNQEINLNGKFERITISELRSRPGDVLAQVNLGKLFLVTKNGDPVAVISKPPGETLTIEVDKDGKHDYGPYATIDARNHWPDLCK